MAKPQSPELRRSGRTPDLDPDNVGTRLAASGTPSTGGRSGPVPPDNQPGHHPDHDQDRPDPREFARHSHEVAERRAAEQARARSEAGDDDEDERRNDDTPDDGSVRGSRGSGTSGSTDVAGRVVDLGAHRRGHTGARAVGVAVGAGTVPLRLLRRVLGRTLRTAADLVDPRPPR